MKKIVFIFFVSLLFLMVGCDKIKTPIQANNTVVDTTAKLVRKVLLEDYTGHKCGNCPAAAEVADNLSEQYKEKLVVIAVHAGDFAKTNALYPTSYTTTAGNDWNSPSGFDIYSAGNPNGLVNRQDFGTGTLIQKESKWPSSVSLALGLPYVLGLDIKPIYNATTRSLNTTVKAGFKTPYANAIKLSVVLVEDSIVGPHTDYRKKPDLVPNYLFMHMLRGAINSSWGSDLKNPSDEPIVANDTIVASFPGFSVNAAFKDKHLYVVAFAYDVTTKEVLQVEKVKIR